MKIKILLILIPFLFAFDSTKLEGLFGIKLQSILGETFALSKLKLNKASVVVFLLPDCPACESYSRTLIDLREKYLREGFEFYGVFPGNYNSTEEMKVFQKTYKIPFPLLTDPENILVHTLNAKIVPSVFLINSSGTVLYKGRIDDWLFALGKKRAVITKHELKDALVATSKGEPVIVKETTAIGCILE